MMKVWNLFSTNTQSFQIKVTLNHSFSKRSPHLKKVKRFHEQISRDSRRRRCTAKVNDLQAILTFLDTKGVRNQFENDVQDFQNHNAKIHFVPYM